MTNNDELAALKKEVAELKDAINKPAPVDPRESERRNAEWIDEMHRMREGRMSQATPPSVVRDFAVLDDRMVKEIALRDARAPAGRPGMIPSTQQGGSGGGGDAAAGNTPGWVAPSPLSPPPGINYVDAQCIADEVRQRAELKRKLGE
jgi:hypothetical protein